MRQIAAENITRAVASLCIKANCFLGEDIVRAFKLAEKTETDALSRDIILRLLENAGIAAQDMLPICQDTGMAVVFVELGQDVHIQGNLTEAINKGVIKGYQEGYLRKSVVNDPIERINTQDNSPAVIHYDVVPGDSLKITVAPKGFGSENMSALKMLKPSQGLDGVKNFVLETVKNAGPNPCPPIIVGVGVGGTMEKAALLAKTALLRPVGSHNPQSSWDTVEAELLGAINSMGIGPAGFGGKTTALAVHISPWPTHIAGLPVAVNIGCHVTRHAEEVL